MKQITNKEYAGKAQKLRKDEKKNESCLIMYSAEDGLTKVEATFDQGTAWLLLDQMAELFQYDKSTISRHIKTCFLKVSSFAPQLLQVLQQFKWRAGSLLRGRAL